MLNVGQGFGQRGAASSTLKITPIGMRRLKQGRCSRVNNLAEHAREDGILEDQICNAGEGGILRVLCIF